MQITKEQLVKALDLDLSSRQMSVHFKCSQTNVRYWIRKHGLSLKPNRNEHRCSRCGETNSKKFYNGCKQICSACHNKEGLIRGQKLREKARQYLGNKCVICGFDQYKSALDFHHVNPKDKDPNFGSMRGWAWSRVEKELDNCVLLCANCHRALHSNEIDSVLVAERISGSLLSSD